LAKGIIIKRKQSGDLNVKLFGAVKMGDTAIDVRAGLSVIGNVYSTDTFTLGNSGLYTGASSTGLAGGSSVTADQVLIYNGTGYQTYYYKTTPGGTGWRSVADFFADPQIRFPAGTSLVVKRQSGRPSFCVVLRPNHS
jgi:hypothetical protein